MVKFGKWTKIILGMTSLRKKIKSHNLKQPKQLTKKSIIHVYKRISLSSRWWRRYGVPGPFYIAQIPSNVLVFLDVWVKTSTEPANQQLSNDFPISLIENQTFEKFM